MWTDEKIEALTKAYEAGYSFASIATMLGVASRNAIAGKIHRLGIKRHKQRPAVALAGPKSAPKMNGAAKAHDPVMDLPKALRARARRSDAGAKRKAPIGRQLPIKPPSPEVADAPAPDPIPAPSGPGVSIYELTNTTCRWPIGDPLTESFRYCGDETADLINDKPYCPHHTQRGFVPRPPKPSKATRNG